jgi:TfoX/Sxy family transcriptional regulator of competence genes
MFWEYGLYCDGKVVAIVCDDRLFVKPTAGGRILASDAEEAPPFPSAKPCLLIAPERWEDGEWLSELFSASAAELPLPEARAKKKTGSR